MCSVCVCATRCVRAAVLRRSRRWRGWPCVAQCCMWEHPARGLDVCVWLCCVRTDSGVSARGGKLLRGRTSPEPLLHVAEGSVRRPCCARGKLLRGRKSPEPLLHVARRSCLLTQLSHRPRNLYETESAYHQTLLQAKAQRSTLRLAAYGLLNNPKPRPHMYCWSVQFCALSSLGNWSRGIFPGQMQPARSSDKDHTGCEGKNEMQASPWIALLGMSCRTAAKHCQLRYESYKPWTG